MPEFAVVAENESDARMAFFLANRIFLEEGPSWMDVGYLPSWINLDGNSHPAETTSPIPPPHCTLWTDLDDSKFDRKFLRSIRRDVSGQRKGFDYPRAHKAKLLFNRLREQRGVEALVLVRDLDVDHPQKRRASLEKVREESPHLVIVLAMPNPNQEAWLLNLFIRTEDEKPSLSALQQELGFDPCRQAHELTAKDETAKRSAKRVVAHLMGNDRARKEICWTDTPLTVLEKQGDETNLNAYLQEVRQHLLPILDPSAHARKA